MSDLRSVEALAAAVAAPVAVFAFRDARGEPAAVPVTPYVHGELVVITSTLAYTRKAQLIREDGRVALLAGGVHMIGRAEVRSDVRGDFFVAHLLDQELAKYPPARALVAVPLHRRLFAWYFGRALMSFWPERVEHRLGDDARTLVTLDANGFPSIAPIDAPDAPSEQLAIPFSPVAHDGPALLLRHRESADMSDLRHASIRGTLAGGVFTVRRRIGSLEGENRDDGELARRRNAAKARKLMKAWPKA